MMHGFGYGFGALGFLVMLLFWVGLVALSAWVVKAIFIGRTDAGGSAKTILDERYARGDINKKDYDKIKKDLSI